MELPDDEEDSASEDNIIRRLKVARQKAMTKKVQEKLGPDDIMEEKMWGRCPYRYNYKINSSPLLFRAETQQLAKIYALLNESEDKFGKVSMKDIKSQMSMYKTD